MVEVLKVSSRSNPNSVAGALAGVIRQAGIVEVQVVGAGALNQAIKAVAIARGFVAPSNIDLVCIPTFADIEIDGEARTAIRLAIGDRRHRMPTPVSAGAETSSVESGRVVAEAATPQAVVADDVVAAVVSAPPLVARLTLPAPTASASYRLPEAEPALT